MQNVKALLILALNLLSLAAWADSLPQTQVRGVFLVNEAYAENSEEHKKLCLIAGYEISQWLKSGDQPLCFSRDDGMSEHISATHDTMVKIIRNEKTKKLSLTIKNLNPANSTELSQVGWDIDLNQANWTSQDPMKNVGAQVQMILRKYKVFDDSKFFLAEGMTERYATSMAIEKKVAENPQAAKEDIVVTPQEFKESYRAANKDPGFRRSRAMLIESAAFLLIGSAEYALGGGLTRPDDTDYNSLGDSMKARAKFQWRPDDDKQKYFTGHIVKGAIVTMLARSNCYNRLESFGINMLTSWLWETLGETNQVVSINDMAGTGGIGTIGGFAMSDFLKALAKGGKRSSPVNDAIETAAGLPSDLARYLEDKTNGNPGGKCSPVELAKDQDFWSKVDFFARVESIGANHVLKTGFSSKVINIPMFDKPGQASQLLMSDNVATELKMVLGRDRGLETFEMIAKATLAAYYQKNMTLDSQGRLRGFQFWIGTAGAIDIRSEVSNKDTRAIGSDYIGLMKAPGGPDIEAFGYLNGMEVHFTIAVYPTFAMVKSLAFDPATNFQYVNYTEGPNCGPNQSYQALVCKRSSSYGYGLTGDASFDVKYEKFSAGAYYSKTSLKYMKLARIPGPTEDLGITENMIREGVWVAYEVSEDFRIEAGVERERHKSRALDTVVSKTKNKVHASLVYKYN